MTSFHKRVRTLAVVAVLASSSLAIAQGKGGAPKAGKAGAPPAAGKADGPAPSADPAKIEQAKKHMKAGAAFFEDGKKCEEAYPEFNKAYELSGSLNALRNRATCALLLEKDGEALVDFKKVLAELGDKLPADDKKQIESDILRLESTVAWVTLKADRDKVRISDVRTPSSGLPLRNQYEAGTTALRLGIHPGDHTFTATSDDGKELTWKVTIANGSTHEHTFELAKMATAPAATATATVAPTATATGSATAPAGETTRPVPTSVKVLAGVTGAFAVGAGVMIGLASVAKSDYDKANGNETDLTKLQAKRDNVVLMNGIADGLLGGTVLAAGTTLILFLIRPSVTAEGTKSGFYITPAVTPVGGGAVAGGRF